MRTLYFDRLTLKGQNFKSHTSVDLHVSDNLSLSKSIKEYDKDIQKTDENGKLLYLQNNYETIVHEDIVGYEETIKVTDTPAMESIQKVNEDNQYLYLEIIYSEEGEISSTIETINEYSESGVQNQPIMVEQQKKSPYGKPLYLTPIINRWEEEVVVSTEETTEPIHVLTWKDEEKTIIVKVPVVSTDTNDSSTDDVVTESEDDSVLSEEPELVEEEKIIVVSVPDRTEENQPIMIPVYKDVVVDIFSRPEEFEINEVLEVVYAEKMENYNYSNLIVDMFMNEDDVDFTYEEHSANTGAFILTLLPYGKVRLKTIDLETPASKFEIMEANFNKDIDVYINDTKFVDGIALLSRPATKCTLRFENKSNKLLDINSYSIMY